MEPYVHDAVLDMQMARDRLLAVLDTVGGDDWVRYVPYGSRTLHDLLAHLASADHAWAVAAQGLLKSEGAPAADALTPESARAARERGIQRGRGQTVTELREEMDRRRRLLLGLYGLLEKRHLAARLPSFAPHDSVRERIWRGYHDRLHAADVERALRLDWHPPKLRFLPELEPVIAALSPDETLYVIYSVDPTWWERPAPGLDWTFRQLLAHISTGDWVLQHQLRHIVEHDAVAEWPDVTAGNARLVEERRFTTEATLTESYLSMRHETFLLLSQLTPGHLTLEIDLWFRPPPNRRTVLDYLQAFEMHDRTHREQLRLAMKWQTTPRA